MSQLDEQAEAARIELEGYLEQHRAALAFDAEQRDLARETLAIEHERQVSALETSINDLETMRDLFKERADAGSHEIAMLQGEVEIFKARDELWAKWEIRERARLEAETARMAASKQRALDVPQYDAEG